MAKKDFTSSLLFDLLAKLTEVEAGLAGWKTSMPRGKTKNNYLK